MAEAIRDGLRLEAIAADIAGDGDTALELLSVNAYDIAVLDRDIPGPSGDDVARGIVASGSGMPILMLTAADRLDDKASGFELGADDYLTKPFALQELVLRLRALDRRRTHARPPVREIAGLRLDPLRREVYRDGRYVALTGSSSRCSRSWSAPTSASSAPRSSSSGRGTRTPTRSPTPCASRSRLCASGSANHGSSRPCRASATALASGRGADAREASVHREPGLSVRLKLTLSYAGFLMLAGALLLAAVWVFLLRYVPDVIDTPGGIKTLKFDLVRAFAPAAAAVMLFLLVFGLLGGWILAGSMLAPLTRVTNAARQAANGSLAHRIQLEGRNDEFRELADAFDTMLARLEAHDAEQQRFAANASHELRTPLAITQTLLDVARKDPNRDSGELVERLRAVNTRAIDLTEALLVLSRSDQRSFAPELVDLSLIADEAVETLLPLAEARGITIQTGGEVAPTIGSRSLLLQLTTNLLHNAIVHNLPDHGTVRITTEAQPPCVVLTVENSGEELAPQLVATLGEPFRRGTGRIRADHAGLGLGLAIVKSIARAHGGTLTLTPRRTGGLCVTVQLPPAPPRAGW